MDDKRSQETKTAGEHTDDFKASIQKATEAAAAQVAFWKEFWEEWIPGGRKRKRYRTKGHGRRKGERRRKNKAARASRKKARPNKKRRR